MARSLSDEKSRKSLLKARKVEEDRLLDDDEVLGLYREGMTISQKLKKLLKPCWFVRDIDRARRKK